MNIGEKIKRIRQHRRMTQKELGEAEIQKKLYAGEITQAEYFEWKIMWPDCDDLHI